MTSGAQTPWQRGKEAWKSHQGSLGASGCVTSWVGVAEGPLLWHLGGWGTKGVLRRGPQLGREMPGAPPTCFPISAPAWLPDILFFPDKKQTTFRPQQQGEACGPGQWDELMRHSPAQHSTAQPGDARTHARTHAHTHTHTHTHG